MRSTPAQRDQARALAVDLGLGEGWLDVLPLVTFSRPVLAVADLDGWSAADLHAVPGVGAERLARLVTAIRRRGIFLPDDGYPRELPSALRGQR